MAGRRLGKASGRMFFFEKKNQKTFPGASRAVAPAVAQAPTDKSFLLLFFKKEALPFPFLLIF
jgi:hypothetical protein